MIEEALQRRIDAIKDKIDIEKRERERRIRENNEKFDELQRRLAVEEMVDGRLTKFSVNHLDKSRLILTPFYQQ